MLQLMAGAERVCYFFEWGRELLSYFQMGSRDEKVWEPMLSTVVFRFSYWQNNFRALFG